MTFLFVGSSVCRWLPPATPSREQPCLKLVVIATRNFWVHLDVGSTTGDFHPIRSPHAGRTQFGWSGLTKISSVNAKALTAAQPHRYTA